MFYIGPSMMRQNNHSPVQAPPTAQPLAIPTIQVMEENQPEEKQDMKPRTKKKDISRRCGHQMWVEKKVIGKGKRSVNLYNKEQGKQIKWNIHGAKLPPALATRVQEDILRGGGK